MGKRLLVLGAGGHGKVVQEIALSLFDIDGKPVYEAVDFLDDNSADAIGRIADLEKYQDKYSDVFCGIGNNKVRKQLLDQTKELCYSIPVLIHPTAYISPSAVIEAGTVVEPKAIVNANAVVHRGCIISVGAIVDHDVTVNEFVHVNAGAIVKAGASVESGRKLEAGEVVLGYGAAQYNRMNCGRRNKKNSLGLN